MDINVGVIERVKSITTSYTALITDDNILANATSGNIIVSLPSAALKKGKILLVGLGEMVWVLLLVV